MSSQTRPSVPSSPATDADMELERQMSRLGLSGGNRRFLRRLHMAERQLNNVFESTRQDAALQQRISQIYHDMYRPD